MQLAPRQFSLSISYANIVEFGLPTIAEAVLRAPTHEIKYDGYGLRVERRGREVRLIHNWTNRFTWIVGAALKNREQPFVMDGESVVLGDGVSDFNALHSRRHDEQVQL